MNKSVPTFPRFITAAGGVALLLVALSAQATQLQEDFAYPANALLDASLNGGVGFAGAWYTNGSSKTIVSNTDLSYSAGGYKISQAGGALSFCGIYTAYRGDGRGVATPLTNTVWFSALMNNPSGGAAAYLGVNAANGGPNSIFPSSGFSFGISNNSLVVGSGYNTGTYGFTTLTLTTNNGLTQGNTHLLLGCLAFPGGTLGYGTNIGSVMLWADPPDLTHLGAPQWQQAVGIGLLGQSLTNITVGGLNNGDVGAIRFSDGYGTNAQAYTDVTGTTNLNAFPTTPTPSSFLAEDFANYNNNTFNAGLNGGTGWSGPWASGSGFAETSASNALTYSGGGYSVVQAGGAGSFYGGYTNYRGGTRFTATSEAPFPAQSSVWFSALMVASNANSQAYIGFNSADGSLYSPSTTYNVGLSNTCLVVGYGANNQSFNTFTVTTNTTLTQGSTHLILGQILFQVGGNSTLQLWADAPDLTHPGQPQWAQTAYNLGTNLQNVTVGGVSNGAVSAIRCSATATAYTDVTGTTNLSVPMPTVALTPVPAITGNGSNFVFTAATTGSGLVYQWAFNGAAIADTGSTLTVNNASSASRGIYAVTVTNLGGSATASTALEVTNCNLNLLWKGGATYVGPEIWDDASTNWTLVSGSSTRQFYGDGDTVTFDDSATNNAATNDNVTIQSPASPGGINLSNNIYNYALYGATLGGPGQLRVYGTAGVYLEGTYAYTGGTVTEPSSYSGPAYIRVAPSVLTGNVTLNGAGLAFIPPSGSFSGNVSGTNILAQVAVASSFVGNTATLSGDLAHAGPLYLNGGTLILTGSNTYLGATFVGNTGYPSNNTVLVVGSPTALPSGPGVGNVAVNGKIANTEGLLDLHGFNVSINGLSGATNVVNGVVSNGIGAVTLTLGNGNASASYPCDLVGAINLTKVGAGIQTIAGGNLAYTGNTTISNGTLAISGDLTGALTVESGATLAVGPANSITTLAATGVTLGGTLLLKIDTDSGTVQDTLADNTGTLNLAGTLTVTNISTSTLLASNESFQLFSGPLTGNFATVNLPTLPGGLAWNTNNLPLTGTISVVPGSPTLSFLEFTGDPVISGTTLTISATNSGAGTVYLLATTNLVSSSWTPIWTNILGGNGSFNTNIVNAVNPALPQQFYLLSTTNTLAP